MTAATVIGDVFYDHVSDLSSAAEVLPDVMQTDFDAVSGIAGVVGGSAVQFALAALAEGFAPVTVIGKVGSGDHEYQFDFAGAMARNTLINAGIEALFAIDKTDGTGQAIIVYLPNDHRFMVSDVGANGTFGSDDIRAPMLEAVTRGGGLVHVSGHALVQQGRRAAIQELVKSATLAGATIAVDIVPHDIDRFVRPAEIHETLSCADWIFCAESTARRMLEVSATAGRQEVIGRLATFANSVAVFSHPGQATVARGEAQRLHNFDYIPGASSRGQSAHSQASLLAHYLLP